MKVYVYLAWKVRPEGAAFYVCASESRALEIARAWHVAGEPQVEILRAAVQDFPWKWLLAAIPWLLLIIDRL